MLCRVPAGACRSGAAAARSRGKRRLAEQGNACVVYVLDPNDCVIMMYLSCIDFLGLDCPLKYKFVNFFLILYL